MIDLVIQLVRGILGLSALMTLIRVVRGPTLPDRVVALDLVGVLVAGIAVVSAAGTGASYFLDVAIVIALMEADTRLVEYVKAPRQTRADLGSEADSLR